MKLTRWSVALVAGLSFQAGAMAKDVIHTADVGADGKVLRQWPEWISKIEKTALNNYYVQYKLVLNPRIIQQDPGFCSVSAIDASSFDRQLHGQAKVIGKPVAAQVNVLTQLVDLKGPSGDNSLAFQVMCVR
ncbi:hypothetical protein ACIQSO_09115 [Pseudomonas putida]|uniref:hypothetical protein n=1 Tax=Pseudomonas putida TaxID=303 RepID=UPI00383BECA7